VSGLDHDTRPIYPITEIHLRSGGEESITANHWLHLTRASTSGTSAYVSIDGGNSQRYWDSWPSTVFWPRSTTWNTSGRPVSDLLNHPPDAPLNRIVAAADFFLKPINYDIQVGWQANQQQVDFPVPVIGLFNPTAPSQITSTGAASSFPVSDIWEGVMRPYFDWGSTGSGTLPTGVEGYWGDGLAGLSNDADRVVIYDVPTEPLISLGALRHTRVTAFDHQPTYTIGESLASPYIPLDGVWARYEFNRRNINGAIRHVKYHNNNDRLPLIHYNSVIDWSYLSNEGLWDRYFFSGLASRPSQGRDIRDEYDAFIAGEPLANSRTTIIPGSEAQLEDKLWDNGALSTNSYQGGARFTLNRGAFNINSTSVEAWKALIASTEGIRVQTIVGSGLSLGTSDLTLPRQVQPVIDMNTPGSEWSGYVTLTSSQVDELAQAIVSEIKERGPFTSLSDFINRRLVNDASGMAGTLQAAINQTTINNDFSEVMDQSPSLRRTQHHPSAFNGFPYPSHFNLNGLLKLNVPQYLTQGDLLQVLGPAISARSDTFTIRCYGDLEDPVTGEVKARVWGEAVVQRFPDPVVPSALDEFEPDDPERFGRRFRIVSFNWLSPEMVN
jgi:hypothetical protein